MVGEAGEVAEVGDAEERGVEGEGEQGGGGAHRLQIWISRRFYSAHARTRLVTSLGVEAKQRRPAATLQASILRPSPLVLLLRRVSRQTMILRARRL